MDNLAFRSQISREVKEENQQFLIDFSFFCRVSKFSLNFPLSLDPQLSKMISTLRSLIHLRRRTETQQISVEDSFIRRLSSTPGKRRDSAGIEDELLLPKSRQNSSSIANAVVTNGEVRENLSTFAPERNNSTRTMQTTDDDEFVDAFEDLTEYMQFEEKKMNQNIKKTKMKPLKPIKNKLDRSLKKLEKIANPLDFLQVSIELELDEYCCNVSRSLTRQK